MSEKRVAAGGSLISNRLGGIVIAILFGASLAGWIATEVVPPDLPDRMDSFREAWGGAAVKLVAALHLHDPFHSLWYRFALALFFAVLLLCIVSRWRQLALRSWHASLPAVSGDLDAKRLSFELSWRLLESGDRGSRDPIVHFAERYGRAESIGTDALRGHFSRIAALFRKRGYRVISRESAEGIAFAASSGRLRSPGTMLFHAGLLVITIGGVIGSYAGWREIVFVKEGSAVPFPRDGSLALRVDGFDIVTTERLEIRSFVSTVSITDAHGNAVAYGNVEVNHPMRIDGRSIYQSEFTIDENAFARASVDYSLRETGTRGSLDLAAGEPVAIGDGTITIQALRYLPDFRMGREGAFSASSLPANPALEIEVGGSGEKERGWLFLYHRDFSKRFLAPVDLVLTRCEPVYYSGLEVSANPGAGVLLAGFAAATLGLFLMYVCNPRIVRGFARPDAIVVAAGEHRWKASFEREFADLREAIRKEIGQGGGRT
ncbi:MAG: cytochrome c biogenesis protein ResB [Candidatus Krumholzibacteria bacterium]|nr:cytochrome c biogenesis protein ResB [Candidatus Krumholzibacteria bacterium]